MVSSLYWLILVLFYVLFIQQSIFPSSLFSSHSSSIMQSCYLQVRWGRIWDLVDGQAGPCMASVHGRCMAWVVVVFLGCLIRQASGLHDTAAISLKDVNYFNTLLVGAWNSRKITFKTQTSNIIEWMVSLWVHF